MFSNAFSRSLWADDSSLSLKAKVATDLLDRAGHSAPKKMIGAMMHEHFTKDDIIKIKERAKTIGKLNGNVIEGEITEWVWLNQ